MNNKYIPFEDFVLRTPILSFSFYKELTSQNTINKERFKELFQDLVIQEAIFLASPQLFEELQKWVNNKIIDKKKEERLLDTFLKYLSRMSSRCTPFGLFAGCTVGKFNDSTNIVLNKPTNNKRHTRLDMNYLVSLSQDLSKIPFIKEQLKFFPNNSIYKIKDQFRYVEYYYKNSTRHHQTVAIETSDYLLYIVDKAKDGLNIGQLAELLVDEDVTIDEAKFYIEELIEGQLLVSELEPSLSGPEFLEQIMKTLSKIKGAGKIISVLEKVQELLNTIDIAPGSPVNFYIKISDELKKLDTTFDIKYLFQTDLVITTKSLTLDNTIKQSIKKGMAFLNRITLPPDETALDQFKKEFYKRYENSEIPLSHALDVEIGLGYKKQQFSADVSPLVDDLILPSKDNITYTQVNFSPTDIILQKKILNAVINKLNIISLDDNDFKRFEENWDDLPCTLSTMIEIIENNGHNKIYISHLGGSSAGNLLGRFCHSNEKIYNHVKEIVAFEENANKDKILAEIVHLPQSRTGNVLMRPSLRKFEIPYLAKSELKKEEQLLINDLKISLKKYDGPILLKSSRLNKEIIPHLTNAHNYGSSSLPLYNFLADLQAQQKRKFLHIDIDLHIKQHGFIPRIEYGNVILSKATWIVKSDEIKPFIEEMYNDEKFSEILNKFIQEKGIPQFVLLVDGDNELLINFNNYTSVKMLFKIVKNRDHFRLIEFLHSSNTLVKNENGSEYFTNQFIVSLYNDKLKTQQ